MKVNALWFYNPPENKSLATPEYMAKHFDVMCITPGEEREAWIRSVRAAGFNGSVHAYQTWNRLHDPAHQVNKPRGTPPYANVKPNRNNFACRPDDIAWIRDNHPDWLVRYEGGERDGDVVISGNDYVVVDIRSTTFRAWAKSRVMDHIASTEVFDAIWTDNMGVRFRLYMTGDVRSQQYGDPDGDDYWEASLDWACYLRDEIASPLEMRWGGNLQGYRRLNRWQQMAKLIAQNPRGRGVVMNEFAFISDEGDWLSVDDWEEYLIKTAWVVKHGGEVWNVICVNAQNAYANPDGDDGKKAFFGFASHLLAADEASAIRFGRDYEECYAFNDLLSRAEPLGKPTDVCYRTSDNALEWRRDFEGGRVIVRPAERYASIEYTPLHLILPRPPLLATIPTRLDMHGDSVNFQIDARDPYRKPLRYAAVGLPEGVRIDPYSGVISGIVTTPDNFNCMYTPIVRVSNSDGLMAETVFKWKVVAQPVQPQEPTGYTVRVYLGELVFKVEPSFD